MSFLQALVLAAVQGVTELFPVSSLGHAVVLPRLLGWSIDQRSPAFLPFLVMLHLGTAVALLAYFWRDWVGILLSVIGVGGAETVVAGRKLFARIVVGTLPAVVIGFALEKPLRALFGSPTLVAAGLALNGIVLIVCERLRHRTEPGSKQRLRDISLGKALFIGACQAGALIPGLSRSGLTIGAGLGSGLDHAQSARFSFLLAAPIIAGAAVLELPRLLHSGTNGSITIGLALTGGVVAGLTAFASVAFLMRFFRKNEFEALDPFAYYCMVFGLGACLILALGLV